MSLAKGEIDRRPRRFYESAGIAPSEGGWAVSLDGKPLWTPAKRALALPTEALAELIADEWRTQVDRIDFATMHANRLANVALDRTPESRAELAIEASRYAETDLVSHLADQPPKLRGRQEAAWTPLRTWAAETLGVQLTPVVGIIAPRQPPASIEAVRRHAESLDDFRLTAFVHSVAIFGSAVIGLAVERRRLTAVAGHEASMVDEAFQASLWGEDAEAARRRDAVRTEARTLDLWFDALGAPGPA
ncbi:MAG: ATP12 family protein [Alphaproteobacteria bacterium]